MLSVPGITWMLYTWKKVKFYFKQEALKWWQLCCGGDHRGAVVRYSPGQTLCLVGYWVGGEVLVGFTWQALPYKQFACIWERGQCVVRLCRASTATGRHAHCAGVGIAGVCAFLNVCMYILYNVFVCMYVATFYYLQAYTCWLIVCSLQMYTSVGLVKCCHHSNTHSTLVWCTCLVL